MLRSGSFQSWLETKYNESKAKSVEEGEIEGEEGGAARRGKKRRRRRRRKGHAAGGLELTRSESKRSLLGHEARARCRLRRCKLCILGQERSGKSSVARRLTGRHFEPQTLLPEHWPQPSL